MARQESDVLKEFGDYVDGLDKRTRSFIFFALGEVFPEIEVNDWRSDNDNFLNALIKAIDIVAPGSTYTLEPWIEDPSHQVLTYHINKESCCWAVPDRLR